MGKDRCIPCGNRGLFAAVALSILQFPFYSFLFAYGLPREVDFKPDFGNMNACLRSLEGCSVNNASWNVIKDIAIQDIDSPVPAMPMPNTEYKMRSIELAASWFPALVGLLLRNMFT